MTLLVRNEADILQANIEYHLNRGVDYIIATDNLSTDESRDILEYYSKLKVLSLIIETSDTYDQHKWVTRMARIAADKLHASWIINNDADEFWWPNEGQTLDALLDALPPHTHAVSANRTNFVPLRQSIDTFFADALTIREVNSLNSIGKPLPPKVCHRAHGSVTVTQGNHAVYVDGCLVDSPSAPITIFHYPMRGYSQFERKIALGGAAYERNTQLDKNVGNTWRALYREWQKGGLESYYRAQEFDDARITSGLNTGELVKDERLMDFFKEIQFPYDR